MKILKSENVVEKIPPRPPFSKGGYPFTPPLKKGVRGDFFLIAITLLLIGCSSGGKVVATVGNEKITERMLQSEMQAERDKFDPTLLAGKTFFENFKQQALEKLISQTILLAEAKKLAIFADSPNTDIAVKTESEVIKSRGIDPKVWEEMQKNREIIIKLIRQEVMEKIPVAENKIEAYYRAHSQEFDRPAKYRAQQILVDTKELALALRDRISKGEKFEDLARENSVSPDGKRGGDIGYFDSRNYPEIFSKVCERLSVGEVSQAITTDYGFQIFKLTDKKPARKETLQEATEEIRNILKEEDAAKAYEKWFSDLKAQTSVSVDEKALGEVQLEKK